MNICHFAIFMQKRSLLFTYEQKIICSETQLDDIALEQTTCRQVYAGHVVGSRAMKNKKNLHRMIIAVITNL